MPLSGDSQCTDAIQATLESLDNNYMTIENTSDAIELLKSIKAVMFSFESQKYGPLALHEAKKRFYSLRQDKHTSCQQYLKSFKNMVEVMEHSGGGIGIDKQMVDVIISEGGVTSPTISSADLEIAEKYARN
jgi:hypothetical protein